MLSENIKKLVEYGVQAGLVPECERIYTTNLLLEMFCEDSYEDIEIDGEDIELEEVLKNLLDEAVSRGIIEDSIVYRDLFDTRLMNCLMPRPSQVQKSFWEKYEKSPKEATEYFYKLSQDSDYIRRYRVKKDMKWKVDSPYGEIDITVNLSKPEKDPKAIAAAKNAKASSYPKCLLCMENEGYAGRVNHPARENHRIIPITPNVTELCLLTDTDYSRISQTGQSQDLLVEIRTLAQSLCRGRLKHVIVTGIRFADDTGASQMGNLYATKNTYEVFSFPYVGGSYSGTGDLFASCLCAGIARG